MFDKVATFIQNCDLIKGRKPAAVGALSKDGKRRKAADGTWKPIKKQRKGRTSTKTEESRWQLPKGHTFVSQIMVGKHNIRTTSYETALGYKKRLHTVYGPNGKKMDDWSTKALATESAKHHENMSKMREQAKGKAKPYIPIKKPITPTMVRKSYYAR